jgi:hypothetical protein
MPRRLLLVAGLLTAVLLAGSSASGLPVVAGPPALPIPPGPDQAAEPAFVGRAAQADPRRSFAVPQHPFLAPNGRSNMHNDAYMTDTYDWVGPLSAETVASTFLGIEECATMAFDSRDRIVALCGGAEGSRMMLFEPDTLELLGVFPLPPRKVRPGQSPLTDLCGGAYFYLDAQDRAFVATTSDEIWVVGVSDSGFALERTYDAGAALEGDDCLIADLPDWDGRIWFVTIAGGVGVIDRDTGRVQSVRLPSERIVNSFAIDETGGVFIVSDHALYRFSADDNGAPVIDWRQPYDRGTRTKPGQLSQGSGTTPTLIGRNLVAITDNADPRMHVDVYRRGAAGGGNRHVCSAPVFAENEGATENTIIAVGRSLFVENNYGYEGPQSTMGGATTTGGIVRVDVTADDRCEVVWTSPEVAPTSVPKASLEAGLLYVYAKPPRSDGVEAWYLAALDLDTGETVYRRLTGTGTQWNNHYAAIYLDAGGAAYVPLLTGIVRIADD